MPFIDGLRGLAAMAVVFYHAYHNVDKRMLGDARGGFSNGWMHFPGCIAWLNNGAFAVQVFIVISGFCLMLPVATSGNKTLPRGTVDFYRRRIRRIMPPYFAALILSVAGYGLLGLAARHHHGGGSTFAAPHVTMGQLLSHIFMVQNCSAAWSHTIDGPMWSVAAEWHIYILFPLLLVPVWRKLGTGAAVALAFMIGVAPYFLLPNLYYDYTYLICMFGLGMAAAVFCYGRGNVDVPRMRMIWGSATIVSAFVFAVWSYTKPDWFRAGWESSTLLGLLTMSAIVFCRYAEGNPLRRLLESRPARGLGAFSYSIYLVHHPILMVFCQAAIKLHFSPIGTFLAELLVGVPLALTLAYGFYRWFERPFISHRV